MELSQNRGIYIVKLNGSDLSDPLKLHRRFEEIIIHDGARKLLVDLSEVQFMNSMQIGAVVGLHVLAYENLSVVKFVGLHERIKNLFALLGVETLLDMHYARVSNAFESFGVFDAEDMDDGPAEDKCAYKSSGPEVVDIPRRVEGLRGGGISSADPRDQEPQLD